MAFNFKKPQLKPQPKPEPKLEAPKRVLPPVVFLDKEPTYENLLDFIHGRGYVEAKELMVAFNLTYKEIIPIMDSLEERGDMEKIPYDRVLCCFRHQGPFKLRKMLFSA